MPQVYVHFSVLSLDNDVLYTTSASDGGSGQPLAFVLGKGCRAPRAWELAVAGEQQAAWPSHRPCMKLMLRARLYSTAEVAACSYCCCPLKPLGSDIQNPPSQTFIRSRDAAAVPVKVQSSAEADCRRNVIACYCSMPASCKDPVLPLSTQGFRASVPVSCVAYVRLVCDTQA